MLSNWSVIASESDANDYSQLTSTAIANTSSVEFVHTSAGGTNQHPSTQIRVRPASTMNVSTGLIRSLFRYASGSTTGIKFGLVGPIEVAIAIASNAFVLYTTVGGTQLVLRYVPLNTLGGGTILATYSLGFTMAADSTYPIELKWQSDTTNSQVLFTTRWGPAITGSVLGSMDTLYSTNLTQTQQFTYSGNIISPMSCGLGLLHDGSGNYDITLRCDRTQTKKA